MLLSKIFLLCCCLFPSTRGVKIEFNENVEELSFFLEFDSESHFQATLYKTTNEEDLNTILRRSKTQKPGQAKGYQICTYATSSRDAVFSVETSTTLNNSQTFYYGNFIYNQSIYDLEPVKVLDKQPSNTHKEVFYLSIDNQKYVLYEEKQLQGNSKDDEELTSDSPQVSNLVTWFYSKLQDSIQQTGSKVIVEFLIVLDVSVYKKWLKITKNRERAIHNIKYYYTHIANGVKANYDLIKDPGYQVVMHFSGIYMAETERDDAYSLNPKLRKDEYLNAEGALDELIAFMNKKKSDATFPSFDVATGFTDYQTVGLNGIAYRSAACQLKGVSVNKDNGPFQSINTATHEIGHNLGSTHDGNKNYCKHEDQFIMAPSRMTMTERNFKNQFIFSNCSVEFFKKYLEELKTLKLDCLRNVPASMPASNTQEFLSQHPGQKFGIDQQCTIVSGENHVACGGLSGEKNFCLAMSCFDSKLKRCVPLQVAPAQGTSCGNKKWCMEGKCVYDAKAPNFKDSCLAGDHKEKIQLDHEYLNCSEVISRNPHYCYTDYYYEHCCESCNNISRKNSKSCPFGDRFPQCQVNDCKYMKADCCGTCSENNIKINNEKKLKVMNDDEKKCRDIKNCTFYQTYHCYDKTVAKDCCETCGKLKKPNEVTACMYGDHGSWCKERVRDHPNDCIRSLDVKTRCCGSCKNVKDKTKGCKDIDDCKDIVSKDCYDTDVEKNCCETCKKYRNGKSGECRYGNRYKYCKKNHCKDLQWQSQCCELC